MCAQAVAIVKAGCKFDYDKIQGHEGDNGIIFFTFFFLQLFQLLVPKEKLDRSPVILEVTAGRTTGGQQSPYSEDYSQPLSNSIKPLMGYS